MPTQFCVQSRVFECGEWTAWEAHSGPYEDIREADAYKILAEVNEARFHSDEDSPITFRLAQREVGEWEEAILAYQLKDFPPMKRLP